MNVNVITSAAVIVHHALEKAPVVRVSEYHLSHRDFRVIGSVNRTGFIPVIHRHDAGCTGIDGSDSEPTHSAK